MLYCVWQKCKGNEDFRELLLQIPQEVVLVENTTTDKWSSAEIWGCKNEELWNKRLNLETILMHKHKDMKHKDLKHLINVETNKINNVGVWKGPNTIGKLLMICRASLLEESQPELADDLLQQSNIYLFGKKLSFE